MLIHEYDDERTLEEEELLEGEKNFSAELSDLEREGNMPIEELLAMYRYEAPVSTGAGSSMDSSSVELADDLPDMTLDKEEIAKDLLSGDYEEETQSSADDLTPSVTSHEATDFFPRTLRSRAIYDGDKESEGEEDGVSSEDSKKEIMVGSQYQAEVPMGLSHYNDDEKVYEEEDQLLWCPDVLSECKVKDYLREALSQSTDDSTENSTFEHIRDNEQALLELLKCNYDTCEALTRYRSNVKTSKEESPPWLEDECRNFEHALQIYEKNFHLIQKHKASKLCCLFHWLHQLEGSVTCCQCCCFFYTTIQNLGLVTSHLDSVTTTSAVFEGCTFFFPLSSCVPKEVGAELGARWNNGIYAYVCLSASRPDSGPSPKNEHNTALHGQRRPCHCRLLACLVGD
uniref:Mesoderm induction early response protein 3-like n=1 Tax=Sinocyclocheilus grahami TaxID=75366 RepID=A0A672L2X2_SINGR